MSAELERQLAALRADFDQSFARPTDSEQPASLRVLMLRAGDMRCALALDEVATLGRCPPLTPVPTPVAALRGLGSMRGVIVGVYDLAALLGQGAAAEASWIVALRRDPSLAIAFDALEGQHRSPAAALIAPPPDAPPHVAGYLPVGGATRLLLSADELSTHLSAAAARDAGIAPAASEEDPE